MRYTTKIAVVVREDLATWQKLNVTAFLASGIAGGIDGVVGEPYEDGTGNHYLPMFREPVLVHAADTAGLVRTHQRALGRGLATALYTEELFKTDNDEDNRAAVRAADSGELRLVGLAVYGPRNGVDKVCKGLRLHP